MFDAFEVSQRNVFWFNWFSLTTKCRVEGNLRLYHFNIFVPPPISPSFCLKFSDLCLIVVSTLSRLVSAPSTSLIPLVHVLLLLLPSLPLFRSFSSCLPNQPKVWFSAEVNPVI